MAAQPSEMGAKEMNSLEIAELTGKQHAHVMRDIRTLIEQGVNKSNFGLVDYIDKKGEKRSMYKLTKKGSLILASGYNAVLREKIIDRWEALEKGQATPAYQKMPTAKELALMVIKAEEEKERLMLENKEQQEIIAQKNAQIEALDEKSKYVDYVLRSPNTIKMSIIAQDYGMSAKAMNSLLRDYGIQYSQGGVWLLKAKYKQCGYVHGNPFQVEHKNSNIVEVKEHTVWTQKGRLFIYNFLKEKGILPLLERKED